MTYFDFNYVTNPPNDELVDETTQLNENWTDVDNKLDAFNKQPSAIVGPPIGTEALTPVAGKNALVGVWDGSAWRYPPDPTADLWSGWTNLTLRSPRVSRAGFPVMFNHNAAERCVALAGCVQFDGAAGAWDPNVSYEISADVSGLLLAWGPAGGDIMIAQTASSGSTTASTFQSAVVWATKGGGGVRTSVFVRWQGNPGGGNWISLDNFRWWY